MTHCGVLEVLVMDSVLAFDKYVVCVELLVVVMVVTEFW